MRQLYLIVILCQLSLTESMLAQDQDRGKQLLVFRNTGVVDLLYTNEVDSIITNETEQIFYSKDTVLTVPLAELDSVAVGNRNEKKFFNGVKELTKSDDLPWIIRFDGQSVFYRLNTPVDILPSIGMKLFYGIEEHLTDDTLFPFGLSAKVTNVTKQAEEMRVDVEVIPLNEIFERLFYAGPFSGTQTVNAIHRAPLKGNVDLGYSVEIENVGNIGISGNIEIAGDAVININPFRNQNHSHADLTLKYGYGVDVTMGARENTTLNYEELSPDVRIGTFYGLLNIDIATGAFIDFSAELNLGISLRRSYQRRILWNRDNNGNSFELKEVSSEEPYEDEAQIDLTLKGNLFFGPMLRIDFATIGDLVGARAKIKAGPEVEGKISMGMIQNMRNFRPEYYGEAKLNLCSKVALEGYVINRHNLVWGEVDERKFFDASVSFGGHEWNLFPDYTHNNATATTNKAGKVILNVATAIETPTATNLETGFEIVDKNGEIVDSVFVGIIQSKHDDTTVVQTFDSEIILPESIIQEDLDDYSMRPIFHYAGSTMSGAPVRIKKDVLIQPYTATKSNGAVTFISSGPFIGSTVKDSTIYQVGMYLPVPLKENIYQKDKNSAIIVAVLIDENCEDLLIGTWNGGINGEIVTLTFNNDRTTGKYNEKPFSYEMNSPQSGDILLSFTDGETMVFSLVSVSNSELLLIDKRDKRKTTWSLSRLENQ